MSITSEPSFLQSSTVTLEGLVFYYCNKAYFRPWRKRILKLLQPAPGNPGTITLTLHKQKTVPATRFKILEGQSVRLADYKGRTCLCIGDYPSSIWYIQPLNATDLGRWLDVLRAAAWRRSSFPGLDWRNPTMRSTSPGSFFSDHSVPLKFQPYYTLEEPIRPITLNRTESKASQSNQTPSDQISLNSSFCAEKPRLPPPPPASFPRDSQMSDSSLAGRNLARVFGLLKELEYGIAPPRPPRVDSPPLSCMSSISTEYPRTSVHSSLRQRSKNPVIPPRGPSLNATTDNARRAMYLSSANSNQAMPEWCATR